MKMFGTTVDTTRPRHSSLIALGAAALVLLAACSGGPGTATSASSDDADDAVNEPGETSSAGMDILDGETVDLVVPYGPGGSYDRTARAIAPFLESASGATVVVLNEPGAGSLLATNSTFAADQRQVRLQLVNTLGVVGATLGGAEGVLFDLAEFNWIAAVSAEPETFNILPDGRFTTVEEMIEAATEAEPLRLGSTGPGDNFYVNALITARLFDVPVEIVTGFESAPEIYASLLRGELDGAIGALTSGLPMFESGELAPLAIIGEPLDDVEQIAGVPTFAELADQFGVSQETHEILDAHQKILAMGRIVIAPPATPSDLVAAYREAVGDVMASAEFLDAARAQGLFAGYLSASEVAALMNDVLSGPPAYAELVKEAYDG